MDHIIPLMAFHQLTGVVLILHTPTRDSKFKHGGARDRMSSRFGAAPSKLSFKIGYTWRGKQASD
jgi:hypothetical protein